jgi:regulatory protein
MDHSPPQNSDRGGKKKRPRQVKPLDRAALERAALDILKRGNTTQANLRRLLRRRLLRNLAATGGDRMEAERWLEAVVTKMVERQWVDDATYARARATSMRNSGRSLRRIAEKLRIKGVSSDVVDEELRQAQSEVSDDEAATIWARKKRLGPFRANSVLTREEKLKDVARLVRAGFSYAVARRVIDGARPEGETSEN